MYSLRQLGTHLSYPGNLSNLFPMIVLIFIPSGMVKLANDHIFSCSVKPNIIKRDRVGNTFHFKVTATLYLLRALFLEQITSYIKSFIIRQQKEMILNKASVRCGWYFIIFYSVFMANYVDKGNIKKQTITKNPRNHTNLHLRRIFNGGNKIRQTSIMAY